MAGLSRRLFGDFSATFPVDHFAPKIKFLRLCGLAWFHPSSSCSFDYISRVVGKIDVSGAIERLGV
ncbi:hypothetical protein Bca101_100894 [Brassica carinata]